MDRRKTLIAALIIAVLTMLISNTAMAADKEEEALKRALYHVTELSDEIKNTDIKDREVILNKILFVKGRLLEQINGSPTEVKKTRPIMNERSK